MRIYLRMCEKSSTFAPVFWISNSNFMCTRKIYRRLAPLFLLFLLFVSTKVLAVGWTPTDAGLVLNFEPGDQFLLSVVIDGKE